MTVDDLHMTDDCLPLNSTMCLLMRPSFSAYVAWCCLAAAVVIFTVWGNLLVIISVIHFRQLHTPTNVLILSLAVSDCLVGLFVMPVYSITFIDSCILFPSNFCSFSIIITWQVTFVSVYTILLIATDRYLALSNPFLYTRVTSVPKASVIVIHVWVLSLVYNGTLLHLNGNFSNKCPSNCSFSLDKVSFVFDLVAVFILPCAAIIVLYLNVFFIARRHAVIIRASLNKGKRVTIHNNVNSIGLERKAAKVVGILVSAFVSCLIPYYMSFMLYDILSEAQADRFVLITVLLFFCNSTINPIIYALFYPWFQKSIKLILTFKIFRPDSSLINVL